MPPPGRPYGIRQELARVVGKIKTMPTLGSISDRIRTHKSEDDSWASSMERRLDAIEQIKARAKPIIEREIEQREFDTQSLESDALALERMAKEITGNSTASRQSSQGSGQLEGQKQPSTEEKKPAEQPASPQAKTVEQAVAETRDHQTVETDDFGTLPSQLKFNPEEARQ